MIEEPLDEVPVLWCHVCNRDIPSDDPTLLVTFSPQGWTLYQDGSLDIGWPADVFVDVAHLSCGGQYRVLCNTTWQVGEDGPGEYVAGRNAGIELIVGMSDEVFYFDTDDKPEWKPTYLSVLRLYQIARDNLNRRMAEGSKRGDES